MTSKDEPIHPQGTRQYRPLRLFAFTFFIVIIVGSLVLSFLNTRRSSPRVGQLSASQIASGRQVYSAQCARCHGVNLEGQPHWTQRRPDGTRPAPPHDASGHTWHHADQVLFEIVKHGMEKYETASNKMTMPAFDRVLSDEEIWAAIAYIKSTWPADIQQAQEQVNKQDQ